MTRPSVQAPAAVVMVRPHAFTVNTQTAQDNAFQAQFDGDGDIAQRAYREHSDAIAELESHGVHVHVFEGEDAATPDCVFPNNWFSTHSGGHVAIYPMKAANRRLERRTDVIEMLKTNYRVQEIIDYSGLEQDNLFLEGTGAMVLDHIGRVAYAAQSDRTSPIALERFCTQFSFEPMVFPASDSHGAPIYHTNVLMCIGTEFALLGANLITDAKRRAEVCTRLEESGRTLIPLTEGQIAGFAGNAIELQGNQKRLLALSQTAYDALDLTQRKVIEQTVQLVPLKIPTIEMAGGSVRCTIAGVHLAKRFGSAH